MARRKKIQQLVRCQIFGARYTKRGIVGHMRFKHGKDHKAPMFDVERPAPIAELRRKAALLDSYIDLLKEWAEEGRLDKISAWVVTADLSMKEGINYKEAETLLRKQIRERINHAD